MQQFKEILEIILSWPTVAIITVYFLKQPLSLLIKRLIDSNNGKAKIGPIEIELGKLAEEGKSAISKMNEINVVIAKSRLLELEITENTFGPSFTEEQRDKMNRQISDLKRYL